MILKEKKITKNKKSRIIREKITKSRKQNLYPSAITTVRTCDSHGPLFVVKEHLK